MRKINNKHSLTVCRAKSDKNGNPRYVISWVSLGLDNYKSTPKTREAGLTKYKGKDFAGGFVFQSYNLDSSLDYILETVQEKK